MAELRKDPCLDQWVILCPERRERPRFNAGDSAAEGRCPFCPGHEEDTAAPLDAVPSAGAWRARAVWNRYPALRPTEPDAYGRHEVLIECRDHSAPYFARAEEDRVAFLQLVQRRLRALRRDPALRYAAFFSNRGASAGATVAHPHAQILATPFLPPWIERSWLPLQAPDVVAPCALCDELQHALRAGATLVCETSHHVALVPRAPSRSYEVWIVPRDHQARWEDMGPAALGSFAASLAAVDRAVHHLGVAGASNWALWNPPLHEPAPAWHWSWRCLPVTAATGGFEVGFGGVLVTTPPEEAAQRLRAYADHGATR